MMFPELGNQENIDRKDNVGSTMFPSFFYEAGLFSPVILLFFWGGGFQKRFNPDIRCHTVKHPSCLG